MVVLMTLSGLGEAYERGSEAEAVAASQDWSAFARLLEEQRTRALRDPLWNDVRQSIVGIAAPHAEDPDMEAILARSAEDPNYLVRRDAIQALEAADRPVPRAIGPVETRHSKEDLRAILEWSRQDHRAVFETAAGTFEARLFTRDAPLTCWNFAQLAERGFYDNGSWHRVVPDFVLQDGCPRGDGWGGPPYQIRCEINHNRYGRGALGMALSGKDTGGSQFFFTHAEQPHLDGGYTVFGELVQGRGTADQVDQGDPIATIRVVED
jgi:cyclophilin family peptidyl-prolyl cis-trans isomerase